VGDTKRERTSGVVCEPDPRLRPNAHGAALVVVTAGASAGERWLQRRVFTVTLPDRFLFYVHIDTQADEHSDARPSTAKQLKLCHLLASECEAMRLADVSLSEFAVVMATVPATVPYDAPTIA
jgi:hypothetical protein